MMTINARFPPTEMIAKAIAKMRSRAAAASIQSFFISASIRSRFPCSALSVVSFFVAEPSSGVFKSSPLLEPSPLVTRTRGHFADADGDCCMQRQAASLLQKTTFICCIKIIIIISSAPIIQCKPTCIL